MTDEAPKPDIKKDRGSDRRVPKEDAYEGEDRRKEDRREPPPA